MLAYCGFISLCGTQIDLALLVNDSILQSAHFPENLHKASLLSIDLLDFPSGEKETAQKEMGNPRL